MKKHHGFATVNRRFEAGVGSASTIPAVFGTRFPSIDFQAAGFINDIEQAGVPYVLRAG